jgi:hypothetical protein
MTNYELLWRETIEFFSQTQKTSWGKREVVTKLQALELDAARKGIVTEAKREI